MSCRVNQQHARTLSSPIYLRKLRKLHQSSDFQSHLLVNERKAYYFNFCFNRKWDMSQRDHVKTLSNFKEVDSNEQFDCSFRTSINRTFYLTLLLDRWMVSITQPTARKIKETLLKQKRQFYLFVCLFLVTQETGIFQKKFLNSCTSCLMTIFYDNKVSVCRYSLLVSVKLKSFDSTAD